jgi:hypothetical protein
MIIDWQSDSYGSALGGLLAVSIDRRYNNFIAGQVWDIQFFGNWPKSTTLAPNNYYSGTLADVRIEAERLLKELLERHLAQ